MRNVYWETLSTFESRDYVAKWYKTRHQRQLNAARTIEIASCFTQGREYFSAAASASSSVRPLLLYYGVLSLGRGIILLRDRNKREANLKPSHGLEAFDWNGTLSPGIEHVLDLQVRASNGTFSELVAAAGNVQLTGWWSAPGLTEGYYHTHFPALRFLTDGTSIRFKDLLSRDYRFLGIYENTTGDTSRVHFGEIVATQGIGIDIGIYTFRGAAADVVVRFGLPANTPVSLRQIGQRLPIANIHARIAGNDLNALKVIIPASHFKGPNECYIIEDFNNGDRISELHRTYLMAYILGMLVRYYPSKWISIIRNEKGDIASPVLGAAVNTIAADFPALVVGALS